MVHHFCFMRPIRSLFGFLLLAGAVVCFCRAMESSRFNWFMEDSQRQSYDRASATTITAQMVPDDKPDRVPTPPQPSDDGNSPQPDWVDHPPQVDENGGVFVAAATSGPWKTLEQCNQALNGDIDRVVTDFAEKEFQPAVDQPVKLDREVINDHLVKERFHKTVESSVGPMQQEYALLEFGSQVRAAIADQWRALVVFQRLLYTARVAGTCFLALGGVYLLLRWKPATR